MDSNLEYSRPQAAAMRLADHAEDCHRFLNKRVLLTGEVSVLETANGRDCLLGSLRLLPRICPNVSIALPREMAELVRESRNIANQISFGKDVEFLSDPINYSLYDAILSIGTIARPELPWTVINSNGWVARASSASIPLPGDCSRINPIGAFGAACLGAGEVFKRLLRVKPERGRLLNGLSFSLYSYSAQESDYGPLLPSQLTADLLIIGVGAIGNGIVYLMSRLPFMGRTWIVDSQRFGLENLGTCVLIGPAEIGEAKAQLAAKVLSPRLQAKGFHEELSVFKGRLGIEVPYPQHVVCALDNIDTRHEAQGLWPDLIIDGAISDFGCQVSRHPWGADIACLICLFRHPAGERAEKVASRATGLSLARTRQADSKLTEQDVFNAPAYKQDWLRARIGRPICSVVQEGVAQQISEDQQRKDFEPSAPFVACFSACMVMGELVKAISSRPSLSEPRFQFDILRGPAYGEYLPQERRRDCICFTRKSNIELVRSVQAGLRGAA